MQLKVTVNGVAYDVEVEVEPEPRPALGAIFMTGGSFAPPPTAATSRSDSGAPSTDSGEGVRAPLNGTVSRVLVEDGQAIETGDVVVVLEAMKMETEITAPQAGVVGSVLVAPGDAVTGGQLLLELC
jgi:methylmalonyl-CoA carboxyltransferase small subunit